MDSSLPTYNLGMVGHVSNGKTTIVHTLTQTDTKRSVAEKKYGRTIKLGYANAYVFACHKCHELWCENREQVLERESFCTKCEIIVKALFGLSFIDAPGHHDYVATMAKGTSLMDMAIVVTDITKEPNQVQTMEHLAILEVLQVSKVIVVQNKCDVLISADTTIQGTNTVSIVPVPVNTEVVPNSQQSQGPDEEWYVQRCIKHHDQLRNVLCGTVAANSPIIPICAHQGYNFDYLLTTIARMLYRSKTYIVKMPVAIPYPSFSIVRSFDINKPGATLDQLRGGVIGGSVLTGTFRLNEDLVILPGYYDKVTSKWTPIYTRITGLRCEDEILTSITSGGLYAIGTTMDPCLTMADRLTGQVAIQWRKTEDKNEDITQWMQTQVQVEYIPMKKGFDGKKLPKVEKEGSCILLVGNSMVQAQYKGEKKGDCHKRLVTFKIINQPLVLTHNRILVYCQCRPIRLIGCASLKIHSK